MPSYALFSGPDGRLWVWTRPNLWLLLSGSGLLAGLHVLLHYGGALHLVGTLAWCVAACLERERLYRPWLKSAEKVRT